MLGANDRVRVGFNGYGLIGAQHVFDFKNQKDADLAAMCDVYQPRLEQGVAACGGAAKPDSDFRRMLDNPDLQTIVVCTPDHWHALMTMMACASGKDVYVEKPLTVFVKEGRWMTSVAGVRAQSHPPHPGKRCPRAPIRSGRYAALWRP